MKTGFKLIFSRYFIERTCESAKFLISLSILLRNNQHRSITSPFLLGVSLSLQDRALGGAYTFAHGEASGFLFFRTWPRAQDRKLPTEAAMLLSDCPYSHHPAKAGKPNVRQAFCILLFGPCRTSFSIYTRRIKDNSSFFDTCIRTHSTYLELDMLLFLTIQSLNN